ncbi:alpha-L-rhamnosidase-related protein [Cohnella cholangitidis]|uniref:Bacterial alpha-L-rhamnosidase n=1 Tax=Cohnella cholangitidis TaxID=2598458 RepID=A0A7G5BZU7_9BACL|nr:sugar hydrolase [Cohnella cholangitidis]QMV42481.1 Bacterial alpha-L-rhamnosidase [Cohnella cholangitidis]
MSLSFVEMAESLKPELIEKKVYPTRLVEMKADTEAFQGWAVQESGSIESLRTEAFSKGDSMILDFGDHHVGRLTLSLQSVDARADSPVRLKFIFGEMPCEIAESFDDYEGWLDRSWLQDEIVNFDVLPGTYTLPRRYTFRYLKIEVISPARKFKVEFPDIYVTTETSADVSQVPALPDHVPEQLREMDRIAVKTLQDCMQTVFEDGPKRDRRLWIGDLRLQALANYYTFNNHELVRRCLYLFAGLRLEGGQVGACVYEKPEPAGDDIYLYDYSLFFVSTLYDYYSVSEDRETLVRLWPVALEQIEISLRRLDERGIVKDDPSWYCFTDWHEKLNKQASAQAILIYCLKRGLALAVELELETETVAIRDHIERVSDAALAHLWDQRQGYFVSGTERQVSWASQVWMALAEVMDTQANGALMDRLFDDNLEVRPMTPYMYHHLIEALISSGRKDKALEQMKAYWGQMASDGADTFWEVYNPEDKKNSPYGSNLINSYCHAWSCTPTYFIRKYFLQT